MKANGVARRLRRSAEHSPHGNPIETVICGKCGERFALHFDMIPGNAELVKKQAIWVANELVWDHIQERKHHGTMDLPHLQ